MSPLSGVLGEAWALYRRHAAHFMLISFSIYLVIAVINALLSWGLGTFGAFIGLIFTMFGMFLLQSALVLAVQDVRDGRVDLDLRATLSAAMPFLGSVAVASILAAIGIGIGFVLIIVPGLVLLTFWSLIIPEIVIGRAGAFESFGRSWRTVSGYAWNVFGVYIVVFLILIALDIVLGAILAALPYGWRSFISSLVSGGLVAPFVAAVVTLIYYRLTAAHGQQAEPGAGPGYGGTAGGWTGTDQGTGPGYGSGPGYGQPGSTGPGYGGPGYGGGQGDRPGDGPGPAGPSY
ncbi:MAG TPA: hypothetical protein VMI73_18935 [Trebonia sp.]|nr:hypothetical protein [Trebonia sp.]